MVFESAKFTSTRVDVRKNCIFVVRSINIVEMTIDQIIDIERENSGVIHLFRNGLFFRAFERSALGFLDIESYQIIKKHSVKLDLDYIYVGFPSAIMDRVLDGRQYTKIAEDHIVIESRYISAEELESKKTGYQIAEPRVIKSEPRRAAIASQDEMFRTVADIAPRIESAPSSVSVVPNRVSAEVMALIAAFDLENSTPMMCQSFLTIIQQKIAKSSLK